MPSQTPFVGRERELALLLALLDTAGRSDGNIVLVAGEPGVGKTRTLQELAARARAGGWQVVGGRAYDTDGMPPYQPAVEVLRELFLASSDTQLHDQLSAFAADLMLLVPDIADRLPPSLRRPSPSPEHERQRLFDSVTAYLIQVARAADHGLLVLLDDLHWADKPTLLLVHHLVRRLAGSPVLIAGSYRTTSLDRTTALTEFLAALSGEPAHTHLSLEPFSREEATLLLTTLAGIQPAPAVVDALYHETNGNAFFLGELVRHLQAEDRNLAQPQTAVAAWGIPTGVGHVIDRCLGRLSHEAQRVLRVATVLGEVVDVRVLAEICALPEERMLDLIDECMAAGLLREADDGCQFSHALVQHTVYHTLSQARRQRLHRQAAEAIERLYGDQLTPHVTTLASQYRLAGPGAVRQAMQYLEQAGTIAATAFAWEEAVKHWQAVLALIDRYGSTDEAFRCELLLSLGHAVKYLGDRVASRAILLQAAALARARGCSAQLARAALGLEAVEESPTNATAIALLEEALAELEEGDSPLRSQMLGRLARMLASDEPMGRKLELSRQAVEIARRLGNDVLLAEALYAQQWALSAPEHLNERLVIAAEIVRLAEVAGDSERVLGGHAWRITDLLATGDVPALDREIECYGRRAEELHQLNYVWRYAMIRATRAVLSGDYAVAEDLGRSALAMGERLGAPSAKHAFVTLMLELYREQLRLQELVGSLEQSVAQYPASTFLLPALAWVHAELDRRAAAEAEFEQVASDRFGGLPRDENWLMCVARLAETCVYLGDRVRAGLLYKLLAPYSGRAITCAGAAAFAGTVDQCLGRLAAITRPAAAAAHFQAGITLSGRMAAWPWQARSQYYYGQLLITRGSALDAATGRSVLESAFNTARRLGMLRLQQEIQVLLPNGHAQAGSGTVHRYPDGLSVREVDVLRLLAQGGSNREIAERLVLSVRTVERHVDRIYQKLGVHGRSQARQYARMHGLDRSE